jgi:hypothetical protein
MIVGTVTDTSGAVVPNATVTATNTQTGLARTSLTNANGVYVLSNLPIGAYSLTAELQGFRRTVRSGIVLQVNQEARIDLTLEVGSRTESVTVTAEAPLLQSESATVGHVIDNRYNTQIPLNGRDFSQLVLLVPGATDSRSGGGNLAADVGSGISVSGRDNLNNFMLDGASNNARQFGNIAIRPSMDAVQEFNVQSNMYSAEFGQSAFAVVNLVSKSGTNALHGSVFEFLRNDALDARNFFLAAVPQLNRNQFGASAGGPIRKNRTFFFANYEGTRERRGVTSLRTVPPMAWRSGDFSGTGVNIKDPVTGQPFSGNRIPRERFSDVAVTALSFWAEPNYGTSTINNLLVNRPVALTDDQFTARVDHELFTSDRLSVRYTFFQREEISTPGLPGFEQIFPPRNQSAVLTETHVFNPHLLTEYKFSFTRSRVTRLNPEANRQPGYFEQYGINHQLIGPEFEGAPSFTFQRITLTGFGDSVWTPQNDLSNEFTNSGIVTWTRSLHTMKAGYSLTKYQQNTPGAVPAYRRGDFIFRGDFTGHAFADFLLGFPYQSTRVVGTGVETGRSAWHAWFFQDDWKISRKLTLSLGIRWDYSSPLVDLRDRRSVLYPLTNEYGTGLPGQIIVANSDEARQVLGLEGIEARGLYHADCNNFAPRFGFAYGVLPQTVVRGGYGVFFASSQNFVNNFVINRRQPPSAQTEDRISSTTKPEIDLSDPFAGAAVPSTIATQNINPNFRDGYVQQWNLVVQQQVGASFSFEVGYVGNKGTKLSELIYYNVPTPGPLATVQARRPLPKWSTAMSMDSYVTSNYNSLQVKAQKRFSGGLSFLSSYTWSKSIDLSSERGEGDRGGIGGGDQRNLVSYFRGLSGFDSRHRFVISYVWELPVGQGRSYLANLHPVLEGIIGGWQLSGITSFQSGYPFTIFMSGDQNGDGLGGDRPDIIATPSVRPGNPNCYIESASNPQCNTTFEAFATAPATRYGNAGRNTLIGPGLKNWDMGLSKNYRFSERFNLQFRAEFFNLFNNVNFSTPRRNFNLTRFGVIESAGRSREIQFGLKLVF